MLKNAVQQIEKWKPFSPNEAWSLFRLAAFGEAIGWTILISGILIKQYIVNHNNDPVLIAGQIHGTLFIIYITAVIFLYSSLGWSRKRTIVAGLASIPPYGSLLFEQWAAHKRRNLALKTYREVSVRAIIPRDNKILAIQPKDSGLWLLPGGLLGANEETKNYLERCVFEQTGIKPEVDKLVYFYQRKIKTTQQLELFFYIKNGALFKEPQIRQNNKLEKLFDDIGFIDPLQNKDLYPNFLQSELNLNAIRQKNFQTVFKEFEEL